MDFYLVWSTYCQIHGFILIIIRCSLCYGLNEKSVFAGWSQTCFELHSMEMINGLKLCHTICALIRSNIQINPNNFLLVIQTQWTDSPKKNWIFMEWLNLNLYLKRCLVHTCASWHLHSKNMAKKERVQTFLACILWALACWMLNLTSSFEFPVLHSKIP